MNMEKMPTPQEKAKNSPEKNETSRQSLEMEERMRLIVDIAMQEIRKIARMPGKGIDEKGMADTAQRFLKEGLERNGMVKWDDVFEQISRRVEKEIELLKLEGSGQEILEKITRTEKTWQYLAKHVLNREYMLSEKKSTNV